MHELTTNLSTRNMTESSFSTSTGFVIIIIILKQLTRYEYSSRFKNITTRYSKISTRYNKSFNIYINVHIKDYFI